MPYLAKIKYTTSYYMNEDEPEIDSATHIVFAENESEAEKKVKAHYGKMNSAYSVHYNIKDVQIFEPII